MHHKISFLYLVGISLALLANSPSLRAEGKTDYQGLDEFKPFILINETLNLSGVDVVTIRNGKCYLLSLGTTANQAKDNTNVRSKLDTRKIAEAKARKAAAEFIKVEVSTEDRLTELKRTEKVATNEGLRSQITKLIKMREEIIVQKSQVVFAGSKTVATWFSDDGESFNAVVAYEITKKETK